MASWGDLSAAPAAKKRRSGQPRKPRNGSSLADGSSDGPALQKDDVNSEQTSPKRGVRVDDASERSKRHERHIQRPVDLEGKHGNAGGESSKALPQLKLKLKVGGTMRTAAIASPQDHSPSVKSPQQGNLLPSKLEERVTDGGNKRGSFGGGDNAPESEQKRRGRPSRKQKEEVDTHALGRPADLPASQHGSGDEKEVRYGQKRKRDESRTPKSNVKVWDRSSDDPSPSPDEEPGTNGNRDAAGHPLGGRGSHSGRKRALPLKLRDSIDAEGDGLDWVLSPKKQKQEGSASGKKKGKDSLQAQIEEEDDEDEPPPVLRRGASSGLESEWGEGSSFVEEGALEGLPGRKPVALTARQRSMQGREESPVVDFMELTHTKKKVHREINEAERLLKKEEAARKRKLQSEKAKKEVQAATVQKILTQEGGRRKREAKLQQKMEEKKEEQKAAEKEIPVLSLRYTYRPDSTVLSFSPDLGLPHLFQSGPPRLPPLRPGCAGPDCGKQSRYSCSTLRLPLCSLACYKATRAFPLFQLGAVASLQSAGCSAAVVTSTTDPSLPVVT